MDTLRLLLVLDSLEAGGTERQAVLLSRELKRLGWAVRIVVLGGDIPLAREGGEPLDVAVVGPEGTLSGLRNEVRRFRPDIIESFSGRPHAYCLALKALHEAPPWVVAIRDSAPLYSLRHPTYLATDWLVFRVMAGVTALVSNSEAALRNKGLSDTPRAHFIHNMLDPRFRPQGPAGRARARASLVLTDDAFIIGTVCNTTVYKGLEFLIEAVETAANEHPGIHLVMAGKERGDYGRRILQDAKNRLGRRFTFLGPREDIPDLLPAFDLYCSSSRTEGTSNSIAEAMASGLPCVATDAGDTADLIGDTGWVVPTADAAALSKALGEAARTDAASLSARGNRARERISRLWDGAGAAAAHDRLYRALLREGR